MDQNIQNFHIPTVVAKLTAEPIISDLFGEEGDEQGDVGDGSEDGDAAVEDDEGVVGAGRQPVGKWTIGQLGLLARTKQKIYSSTVC